MAPNERPARRKKIIMVPATSDSFPVKSVGAWDMLQVVANPFVMPRANVTEKNETSASLIFTKTA